MRIAKLLKSCVTSTRSTTDLPTRPAMGAFGACGWKPQTHSIEPRHGSVTMRRSANAAEGSLQAMPIEIEKKYRLTLKDRRAIEKRLRAIGSKAKPLEHEENTIYRGGNLGFGLRALRLRRVNGAAILTFKERIPTESPIKHQHENETSVDSADATDAILRGVGFEPALVYEKRRTRWDVGKAKVVIDELPYGLFMEIEASE